MRHFLLLLITLAVLTCAQAQTHLELGAEATPGCTTGYLTVQHPVLLNPPDEPGEYPLFGLWLTPEASAHVGTCAFGYVRLGFLIDTALATPGAEITYNFGTDEGLEARIFVRLTF